jgi:hypothetical protein
MTNFLRCLPVGLLFGLLSCSEEAPAAAPDSASAGGPGEAEVVTPAADAAQLPEVRYYVVADT